MTRDPTMQNKRKKSSVFMHSYVSPHICLRHSAFVEVRGRPLGINSLSTTWVLRTKLLSSGLVVDTLTQWVTSPTPPYNDHHWHWHQWRWQMSGRLLLYLSQGWKCLLSRKATQHHGPEEPRRCSQFWTLAWGQHHAFLIPLHPRQAKQG